MDWTQLIYGLTEPFPRSELYGLTSQMRRSTVSIPSNIAEGAGRATKRDFANLIVIAPGSNYELETQILIAERLGYIDQQSSETAIMHSAEIGRLLKGLLIHLKSDLSPQARN